MTNAIILHGKEDWGTYFDPEEASSSNYHWLPWLQKQLLLAGINAQTPEIPNSWNPDYPTWQREFERYDLTPDTILVGHSCGGGFLVRWLSEHPQTKVGKVVLVAPWINPFKNGLEPGNTFLDFNMDPNLSRRVKSITIFISDDDAPDIQESVKRIKTEILGVKTKQFQNYGHFCFRDMHTTHFPELLQAIVTKT